ncbi:hypothetical protein [Xylanibacter rarus]|uniref:hypothetical protein n=1 Tax=Xylanibacter rarus TaxID=1676614 RepID=UPI003FEE7615
MDDYGNFTLDENMFSTWLDGNMTPDEEEAFMDMCADDPAMGEILDANDQVDDYYENLVDGGYEIPEELDTDFDLPYISPADEDDDIYSYEDIEPYDDSSDSHDMTDDGMTDSDGFDDDNATDHFGSDTYQDMDLM